MAYEIMKNFCIKKLPPAICKATSILLFFVLFCAIISFEVIILSLDKDAKRVLKYAISQTTNEIDVIPMYDVPETLNIKPRYFVEICKTLEKEEFLTAIYTSDLEVLQIVLTHKGITYLVEERKAIAKSIFTPISITIITNLIISGIKLLFPYIVEWFSTHF